MNLETLPNPKEQPKNQLKLNIAIVCDTVTDYMCGSFVATLRFMELLSKKGHKIIFIGSKSPSNRNSNFYKNIKVYRFFSLPLPKTEKQLYLSFPSVSQIKQILREEKIDILHVMVPTPAAIISIRAAKSLRLKIVAHSHTQPENIFLQLPKITFSKKISQIFYKYLEWIYKQADIIIYPTEFAKKFFIKLNAQVKTAVISNSVDTNKFKPIDAAKFFEKFNLARTVKIILFVGRLHPEKSIDTLIKSAPGIIKKEPQTKVLIVGSGNLKNQLRQLAGKLGLNNQVIFLGKLSNEDLIMAYNACDIFVLPSLAELEGMVVLEAMACGKPLIIADSKDSASKYLVNGNGLLFEPKNAADLARQALKLLSDGELRRQMGEISLRQSRQYDIKQGVQQLEKLYYSILAE